MRRIKCRIEHYDQQGASFKFFATAYEGLEKVVEWIEEVGEGKTYIHSSVDHPRGSKTSVADSWFGDRQGKSRWAYHLLQCPPSSTPSSKGKKTATTKKTYISQWIDGAVRWVVVRNPSVIRSGRLAVPRKCIELFANVVIDFRAKLGSPKITWTFVLHNSDDYKKRSVGIFLKILVKNVARNLPSWQHFTCTSLQAGRLCTVD